MSFTIGRGTNISHWLSQSPRRGEERRAFFAQHDVRRIAEMGFDHVRLPIDEQQMWHDDGAPDAEAFALLDAALDWCKAAKLRVVVDLHLLRTHDFMDTDNPALFADPEEEGRFVGLWQQLSDHLRRRPTDEVAYELLNEAVARDPEDWNRVALAAFSTVRRLEPQRTIVLGSNWYNQHHTFNRLRIPGDKCCILTFHYYLPMFITHYTAGWWSVGGTYRGPIHYPGKPIAEEDLAGMGAEFLRHMGEWNRRYGRDVMAADLEQPLAVQARTGLPLYCGEFGCYERTPDPLRLAWFRDILAVFAAHDIAWANWDYKGVFGIVTQDGRPTAIASALTGRR
jgi:endoglucanase